TSCWSCHAADYHATTNPDHDAALFPQTCQTCHTTTNWNSNFNHSNTDFPLTGAHVSASCNECHASGQYNGLPTSCWSCHAADYHATTNPDHDAALFPQTCQTCHTTTNWNSNFNHANTDFPLTGAHVSASCNECHASGQYNGLPTSCWSCHAADYHATTNPDHDAALFPQTCQTCHTTTNWNSNFNHSNTDFPLTGAHVSTSCNQCHASGQYNGLPSTCYSCHAADYNGTNDPDHQSAGFSTSCQTCHTTTNWSSNFNHSNTDFPLTGAHVSATCVQCHASGQYNGLPTGCYSCHTADYNSATDPPHSGDGIPHNCEMCHTTSNWNSNFNHDGAYFPIYSGEHRNEWNTCSECHTNSSNYAVFACINCHEHSRSETDGHHEGVSGYVYASSACYSCHPDGRE
ncbi:hypothetical protein HZB60_11600, partial [candidate division KSB1 bacterium]|nr:hypothetical protein [candidate division KSB1 bacterium]